MSTVESQSKAWRVGWGTRVGLGLAGAATAIIGWIVSSGWIQWYEGVTNGAFSGFPILLLCLVGGLLAAAAYVLGGCVLLYWMSWRDRAAWLLGIVLIVGLVSLSGGVVGQRTFVQGMTQWAQAVSAPAVRAWAGTTGAGAMSQTTVPEWWFMKDGPRPFGVSVAPAAVRSLVGGPLPDEVRVFPAATGRVVMGWVSSGSSVRFLCVTAPGEIGPPPEIDRTAWSRVTDDVWIGVREMR